MAGTEGGEWLLKMQEIEFSKIIKKKSALPEAMREEPCLWRVLKGPRLYNNAHGCSSGGDEGKQRLSPPASTETWLPQWKSGGSLERRCVQMKAADLDFSELRSQTQQSLASGSRR